jgi:hypothetical protein
MGGAALHPQTARCDPEGTSGQRRDAATGTGVPNAAATALETVPVPGQPGRAFRVEIGACRKPGECPFQVALVAGNKVLSRLRLSTSHGDWVSATPGAERQPDAGQWGVGDGIVSRQVEGWTTGEDETFAGIVVRPLTLSADVGGILIDLIGGFEHVKRGHFVLVAVDGTLTKGWDYQEGAGWTWSTTDIVNLEKGRQGVAFFHGASQSINYDDRPDSASMEVLGWSTEKRRLLPETRKGRGFAVVVGGFSTVLAAKRARDAKDSCVAAFSIRPLKEFQGKNGFALVLFTSFRDAADDTVRKTRACLPKVPASVVALE